MTVAKLPLRSPRAVAPAESFLPGPPLRLAFNDDGVQEAEQLLQGDIDEKEVDKIVVQPLSVAKGR